MAGSRRSAHGHRQYDLDKALVTRRASVSEASVVVQGSPVTSSPFSLHGGSALARVASLLSGSPQTAGRSHSSPDTPPTFFVTLKSLVSPEYSSATNASPSDGLVRPSTKKRRRRKKKREKGSSRKRQVNRTPTAPACAAHPFPDVEDAEAMIPRRSPGLYDKYFKSQTSYYELAFFVCIHVAGCRFHWH